jgi:allantoin racemase
MRIDVIMLISGLSPQALKRREETLRKQASPGTDIHLVLTRNAPRSVESFAEMEMAAPGILERVVLSENEGADAVVIWGGHDPSVESARELVDIPVLGPGGASMYLASMLARKFALMVQLPHVLGLAEKQVRDLGLTSSCVGVYSVGVPVLELREPPAFEKVLSTAVDAVEDGADALCFGCMALNDHAEALQVELNNDYPGVIVINPACAVIRVSEMIVNMNLSHSKRSYRKPPKEVSFP